MEQSFIECYRVLKKNGALIFSVPFFDIEKTISKAYLENGNIKFIGDPEFHDSRLGGPYSAPVFWHISINNIQEILSRIGFQTEIISFGPNNKSFSQVVYAMKN